MATYPSILAWEIPWTEEPGGLQSVGLQKSLIQLSNWTTNIYVYIHIYICIYIHTHTHTDTLTYI